MKSVTKVDWKDKRFHIGWRSEAEWYAYCIKMGKLTIDDENLDRYPLRRALLSVKGR